MILVAQDILADSVKLKEQTSPSKELAAKRADQVQLEVQLEGAHSRFPWASWQCQQRMLRDDPEDKRHIPCHVVADRKEEHQWGRV